MSRERDARRERVFFGITGIAVTFYSTPNPLGFTLRWHALL
jgi:hypothetical protein